MSTVQYTSPDQVGCIQPPRYRYKHIVLAAYLCLTDNPRERNTLLPVIDKPVTAVTALSLIDCLIWAIIEVPPEPFGGVGVGWLPTC